MSKLYFIDTNIFLRVLIKDDPKKFEDASIFLQEVKNGHYKAWTSGIVLAEVVWTLVSFYKLSKSDVVKAVEGIRNLRGLSISDYHNSTVALELYRTHNVKYTDCLIYSGLARSKQTSVVVSYDTDFDKLGAKRVEPGDLITR